MPDRKQLIERLRLLSEHVEDHLSDEEARTVREASDTLERDAAVLEAAEQFFAHEWPAESSKQRREKLVEYAVDHPALRLFDALQRAQGQVGDDDG